MVREPKVVGLSSQGLVSHDGYAFSYVSDPFHIHIAFIHSATWLTTTIPPNKLKSMIGKIRSYSHKGELQKAQKLHLRFYNHLP